LTQSEAVKSGVTLHTQLAGDLPGIRCDRVQPQQVMLNWIVNAIQSMSGVEDGNRALHISTMRIDPEGVRAAVRDTGPGLRSQSPSRLLEPSTRRSPTAWAWASRSAVRLSKSSWAAACDQVRAAGCSLSVYDPPLTKPSSVIDVAYWQPRGDVRATPNAVNHDFALLGLSDPIRSLRSAKAFSFSRAESDRERGRETRSRRRLLFRHRDSHVLRSHIGGAPVEITTEFRNAILRKTRRRESRDGDDCERLTFDAVVPGQLPHPAQSPVRVYNGQRLDLHPSLARPTISQSHDTKYKVDQGREIAKIGAVIFCEDFRQ
jgi:hypothetical protein